MDIATVKKKKVSRHYVTEQQVTKIDNQDKVAFK